MTISSRQCRQFSTLQCLFQRLLIGYPQVPPPRIGLRDTCAEVSPPVQSNSQCDCPGSDMGMAAPRALWVQGRLSPNRKDIHPTQKRAAPTSSPFYSLLPIGYSLLSLRRRRRALGQAAAWPVAFRLEYLLRSAIGIAGPGQRRTRWRQRLAFEQQLQFLGVDGLALQ